jgi:GTPase SAR1 family protein
MSKIPKPILDIIKEVGKAAALIVAKEVGPFIKKFSKNVLEWWNGRKIAVIGPTGAGKNSLYNRLSGKPIPKEHVETKGINKVENFTYKLHMPDGKEFRLRCKRALNVGGDIVARERAWLEACKGADVIFYIVSVTNLKKSALSPNTRIYKDMVWIAKNLSSLGENTLVHILVNKIDVLKQKRGGGVEELGKQYEKLEKIARHCFGSHAERFTGITPTSMKDDHIFAISFSICASTYSTIYRLSHFPSNNRRMQSDWIWQVSRIFLMPRLE